MRRETSQRVRLLQWVVLIVGVTFIVGVYPLMLGWQSGWRWEPNQHEYEQMIVVIYATLGVFLVRASRDPLRHLSLIWFTVWSTAAHAAVMALHALAESGERGHLVGDVPAAFAIAAVLAWVTARSTAATTEDAR